MTRKIVFMGTPSFAVPILKALHKKKYLISATYTQPPQKSQRGQRYNKSPIHVISEELNIECRTPRILKGNNEEFNFFKKLDVDIVIVVAYGQIIPNDFLDLSKKGFINIHASLLPKWRGAAPIQRSIINLEKETGISIMKIGEKLDTGPVCNSYKINIMADDNSETIAEKLSKNGLKAIGLRYFNVFGERQSKEYAGVVKLFLQKIQNKIPPKINGDGSQSRDFVFVEDVVKANIMSMESQINHTFFNVGTGKNISVLELANVMIKASCLDLEPIHGPALEGDVSATLADITHIKKSLDWNPTISIEEWLEKKISNLNN